MNTIEKIENSSIIELLKEILREYKVNRGYDVNDWNSRLEIDNKLHEKARQNGYLLRGPVLKEFVLMYWELV